MPITPAADRLIDDLAADLRATVRQIESGPETTQGHYGDYLSLLSHFPTDRQNIVALALVRAGANVTGLGAAVRLS